MDERGKSIEVTASSVDEAVDQALERLGLGRDQVEVEVLRHPSRGLLGLLSEDALVRVTAKAPVPAEEPAPSVGVAAPSAGTVDADEVARLGLEVVGNLVNYMGLGARVSRETAPLESQTNPDAVLLNVSGRDLGALIGRRGETLRDLQYLSCLMISRPLQRWPNLTVDVEHYKARRERLLTDLARRMADKVRTTDQSVSLEPMPPNERRIVHLALRDDPDVFTESVGQADRRKVVILPKK